ncbi:MAG: hypothetical protein IJT61_09405 [Bacteroidales bacterium]|nr:hypothetical protein [Bacteroidales bacterium]
MEREAVKQLFGANFIGKDELKPFFKALGFEGVEIQEKPIDFSDSVLQKAANEGYILIYGVEHVGGFHITLRFLREKFGVNPDISEPCLYNQDWYLKEDFMDVFLYEQWYLIKKDVFEDSRAVQPADLTEKGVHFPLAILCGYTFFAYYFAHNEYLWWHDFVWCYDTDHNGDRIYVGKYHDIDGVNKNGFSIHRHLALRNCYASVNVM